MGRMIHPYTSLHKSQVAETAYSHVKKADSMQTPTTHLAMSRALFVSEILPEVINHVNITGASYAKAKLGRSLLALALTLSLILGAGGIGCSLGIT
jgi:RecA-family ATPase